LVAPPVKVGGLAVVTVALAGLEGAAAAEEVVDAAALDVETVAVVVEVEVAVLVEVVAVEVGALQTVGPSCAS